MKRYIIIYGIICLLLVGCNSNKSKYELPSEDNGNTISDEYLNYDYNQDKVQKSTAMRMAVMQDGYLLNINHSLKRYNIQNNMLVTLCTNPTCSHKLSSCEAYLSTFDGTNDLSCNCSFERIFYYNNHIYMIESVEDADFYIVQYNQDFSDEKRIVKIASYNEDMTRLWGRDRIQIYNGYAYYLTTSFDKDNVSKNGYSMTYNCMRVELKEKAIPEKLGEFEGGMIV